MAEQLRRIIAKVKLGLELSEKEWRYYIINTEKLVTEVLENEGQV